MQSPNGCGRNPSVRMTSDNTDAPPPASRTEVAAALAAGAWLLKTEPATHRTYYVNPRTRVSAWNLSKALDRLRAEEERGEQEGAEAAHAKQECGRWESEDNRAGPAVRESPPLALRPSQFMLAAVRAPSPSGMSASVSPSTEAPSVQPSVVAASGAAGDGSPRPGPHKELVEATRASLPRTGRYHNVGSSTNSDIEDSAVSQPCNGQPSGASCASVDVGPLRPPSECLHEGSRSSDGSGPLGGGCALWRPLPRSPLTRSSPRAGPASLLTQGEKDGVTNLIPIAATAAVPTRASFTTVFDVPLTSLLSSGSRTDMSRTAVANADADSPIASTALGNVSVSTLSDSRQASAHVQQCSVDSGGFTEAGASVEPLTPLPPQGASDHDGQERGRGTAPGEPTIADADAPSAQTSDTRQRSGSSQESSRRSSTSSSSSSSAETNDADGVAYENDVRELEETESRLRSAVTLLSASMAAEAARLREEERQLDAAHASLASAVEAAVNRRAEKTKTLATLQRRNQARLLLQERYRGVLTMCEQRRRFVEERRATVLQELAALAGQIAQTVGAAFREDRRAATSVAGLGIDSISAFSPAAAAAEALSRASSDEDPWDPAADVLARMLTVLQAPPPCTQEEDLAAATTAAIARHGALEESRSALAAEREALRQLSATKQELERAKAAAAARETAVSAPRWAHNCHGNLLSSPYSHDQRNEEASREGEQVDLDKARRECDRRRSELSKLRAAERAYQRVKRGRELHDILLEATEDARYTAKEAHVLWSDLQRALQSLKTSVKAEEAALRRSRRELETTVRYVASQLERL